MTDEEENQDNQIEETAENKTFSVLALNKFVAIMFVLGIYLIIFLKILILP